jgi:hypothetical protein
VDLYYGLYANAHQGKVRKSAAVPLALRMVEDAPKASPSSSTELFTVP